MLIQMQEKTFSSSEVTIITFPCLLSSRSSYFIARSVALNLFFYSNYFIVFFNSLFNLLFSIYRASTLMPRVCIVYFKVLCYFFKLLYSFQRQDRLFFYVPSWSSKFLFARKSGLYSQGPNIFQVVQDCETFEFGVVWMP